MKFFRSQFFATVLSVLIVVLAVAAFVAGIVGFDLTLLLQILRLTGAWVSENPIEPSALWTGLFGLMGVIVGGAIQLRSAQQALKHSSELQEQEHRRADRLDTERRVADDRYLANNLLMKLSRISSHSAVIYKHLSDGAEIAASKGMSLSQATQRMPSLPPEIQFLDRELGMLLRLNENEAVELCAGLDLSFNTSLQNMRFFSTKKTEMKAFLDIQGVDPNGDAVVKIKPGHEGHIALSEIELNQLLEQMVRFAEKDQVQANDAIKLITENLSAKGIVRHQFAPGGA